MFAAGTRTKECWDDVAYAPRGVSIAEAADAGMSSIEHMETVMLALDDATEAERRAQFAHLATKGTAITATMVTDVAYSSTIPRAPAGDSCSSLACRTDPSRRGPPLRVTEHRAGRPDNPPLQLRKGLHHRL